MGSLTKPRRMLQSAVLVFTLVSVFSWRANAELWCPLGGVEALYTYAREGKMTCSLGVSNFFLLGGVLASVLLLRRSFCSYLCPIGTISEALFALRTRFRLPAIRISARWDWSLRWAKYLVLAAILYFTWMLGELVLRGYCPAYALISRHGTDITAWAYVISSAIAIASLVVLLPFCRWLCPFAAVLSPFSRFALTRVKRNAEVCSECRACSQACLMAIPVDQLQEVTAARCTACLRCVETCRTRPTRALSWGPPTLLGGSWPQTALITILLTCITGAVAAAYWFPLPAFVETHGKQPPQSTVLDLKIDDVTCRGRANLLVWFLARDDFDAPLEYFRVEAWPGKGWRDVRIHYDPRATTPDALRRAITEPYFQNGEGPQQGYWRDSPFRIEGYDPLALP